MLISPDIRWAVISRKRGSRQQSFAQIGSATMSLDPKAKCVEEGQALTSRSILGLILVLCFAAFAGSISYRSLDPMLTIVAADFDISVRQAALLVSAYGL